MDHEALTSTDVSLPLPSLLLLSDDEQLYVNYTNQNHGKIDNPDYQSVQEFPDLYENTLALPLNSNISDNPLCASTLCNTNDNLFLVAGDTSENYETQLDLLPSLPSSDVLIDTPEDYETPLVFVPTLPSDYSNDHETPLDLVASSLPPTDVLISTSENYENSDFVPPPPSLPPFDILISTDDTPENYVNPLVLIPPPPPCVSVSTDDTTQDYETLASPPPSDDDSPEPYEAPPDLVMPALITSSNTTDLHSHSDIEVQSIYEEMTEPTYDDIAGNTTHNEISNESYIELLPSGAVLMSAVQSNTDGPPYNSASETLPRTLETESSIQLTGFQKLTNEPPPSYDALFGGTLPVSDSVHVSPRRPLTAAPLVVRGQSSMPQQAVSTDRETTWCLAEIYRSPLKTGVYLFIFLIGVFVPLGMLGLGIGIYFTSSSNDKTVPTYFIILGSFGSFFVFWHTIALLVGTYIKSRNNHHRHSPSSCCLRVMHFGALFWFGATVYISYYIWPDVAANGLQNLNNNESDSNILPIVLLGFLAFQYLMILYCCCEFFIDCFICLSKRN